MCILKSLHPVLPYLKLICFIVFLQSDLNFNIFYRKNWNLLWICGIYNQPPIFTLNLMISLKSYAHAIQIVQYIQVPMVSRFFFRKSKNSNFPPKLFWKYVYKKLQIIGRCIIIIAYNFAELSGINVIDIFL